MNTKDEYLVYINQADHAFYFKNRKLHREDGPAIICRKDRYDKTFYGLKDEALYTRVYTRIEPNEQKDEQLFYSYRSESSHYLDGIRFNSKQEMDAYRLDKELPSKYNTEDTKLKV